MASPLPRLAAREGSVIAVAGIFAALVLLGLGAFVGPDTWLALLSGRVVAHGGPPSTDTLMRWTHGRDWVDQQWLGQLAIYGLWRLGGLTLLGVAQALVVCGTFTGLLVAARRRGGAPGHVAVAGLLAIAPVLLVAGNIRTQTLALPLFATVLWLVCEDSRRPSRRVFWTIPLLVVWANLHGSVLLGAGLVALTGLVEAVHAVRGASRAARGPAAGVLLMLAAALSVVASPYGLDVISYFRDLFGNGEISHVASDWMPTRLEAVQLPFFVLAALTLMVLGARPRAFTLLERLVLLATLLGALQAARNLAWFAFAAVLLLPAAATAVRGDRARVIVPLRFRAPLAFTAACGVVLAAAVGIPRIDASVDRRYPPAVARVVSQVAARTPAMRLWIHPRYADWLVLRDPRLSGRAPFDIRYELLSASELRRYRIFRDQLGPRWLTAADGARLVVADSSQRPITGLPPTSAVLQGQPGARRLYSGHDVAVVLLRRALPVLSP